jgi:hypothetical protein
MLCNATAAAALLKRPALLQQLLAAAIRLNMYPAHGERHSSLLPSYTQALPLNQAQTMCLLLHSPNAWRHRPLSHNPPPPTPPLVGASTNCTSWRNCTLLAAPDAASAAALCNLASRQQRLPCCCKAGNCCHYAPNTASSSCCCC